MGSVKSQNAYMVSVKLLPNHGGARIPKHLPLARKQYAVEASLSSSNPKQLIEVLNFLFKHTFITVDDTHTLEVFKDVKLMNNVILSTFADQCLYDFPLNHPNLLVLVSLTSDDVKDEFFNMLAELVSAGIDKSAFDLAVELVKNKQYNLLLVSSLYHTYEENGAVPRSVEKAYLKAVTAATANAISNI